MRSPSTAARRLTLVAALALVLVAPACAGRRERVAPAPMPIGAEALKAKAMDPARRVVLVNVWATWCGPCREELPALVRLQHEMSDEGVEVFLVSADFDKPTGDLVDFLTANGIDFPTYLKAEKDDAFIKAMEPGWSGAIPASFLYSGGQLVDFWEGMATYEVLVRKVKGTLAAPPTSSG